MRLIKNKNFLKALALALCLFVGIVTLINFVVNVKAMLLLDFAFRSGSNWHEDFESITKFMIAKALWYDGRSTELCDMDFYKLTFSYVFRNNLIVFLLAPIEVALVNASDWLHRTPKLLKTVSICFCIIALLTPGIFLLSMHIGGF